MDQTYKYKAVDAKGKVIEGTTSGASASEVAAYIRTRDQKPIKVEKTEGRSKEISIGGAKLPLKDIILFCRQASTMLSAGMTLNRCLEVLAFQAPGKRMKETLREVSETVQKGESLSVAMNRLGDRFPSLLRKTIEAGELTGQLDAVMEKMALHYEKEKKIKAKIKGAMMYPIVLGFVTILAMVILLTAVLPKFVAAFAGSGTEFPALTKGVIAFSDFLIARGWVIAIIIALLVMTYKFLMKTNAEFKKTVDMLKLQFVLIRDPMTKIITSRFTSTLSTLLSSGVSVVQSLQAAGETTQNLYAERQISRAVEGIEQGMGLTSQLEKTGIFPIMMLSMLGIGEESGNLEDMLLKTATYYDDELESAMQQMVTILEPIMILFMGGVIGTVIIAMYLPMFDMFKTAM